MRITQRIQLWVSYLSKFFWLLFTINNGSMTDQFPPPHPTPATSSLLCTLQLPLTLSLTLYMVLLLTGLWRSKLPLLKPCLLNHKTLEPPLFYECMLLAEVSVASLWKVLHFPCLNMPSLGGAFTHNTHRGQPITSMLAKGLVINISMFLPIYV